MNKIIYSCSGCSNVAQLANRVAVKLDRAGRIKMSCIAGIGGDVPPLLNEGKTADYVVGLDGCELSCVSKCLLRHQIRLDKHIILTKMGFSKKNHQDFEEAEFDNAFSKIESEIFS
jgi:uncharacterized metal-binding protein